MSKRTHEEYMMNDTYNTYNTYEDSLNEILEIHHQKFEILKNTIDLLVRKMDMAHSEISSLTNKCEELECRISATEEYKDSYFS